MKHFWMIALVLALPLGAFAQGKGIDWKPGTSVTREYKELTGIVVLNERVVPVLKVGTDEYFLMVGPREPGLLALKNGATITVKGIATTVVQTGTPTRLALTPFEATIDGKSVKFEKRGGDWKHGGPGMKRPGMGPGSPAPAQPPSHPL